MPPVATRRYVSSILALTLKMLKKRQNGKMIKNIKIWKIFEALLALVREIFKGILPTCLNETENLIFKVEYALPEV